jgi:hypothetical protein
MTREPREMSTAELRAVIAAGTPEELRALADEIGRDRLRSILLPPAIPSQPQCEKLTAAIATATDEAHLRKLRQRVSEWDMETRQAEPEVQRRIADLGRSVDHRLAQLRPPPPPQRCPSTTEPAQWTSPADEPLVGPASSKVVDPPRRWERPATSGDGGPAPRISVGDGFDWVRR